MTTTREMATCRNLSIVQGYDGTMTDDEIIAAWQALVSDGEAAKCKGWVADTARKLVAEGVVKCP